MLMGTATALSPGMLNVAKPGSAIVPTDVHSDREGERTTVLRTVLLYVKL